MDSVNSARDASVNVKKGLADKSGLTPGQRQNALVKQNGVIIPVKKDASTEIDQEKFFEYVWDFLKAVELSIAEKLQNEANSNQKQQQEADDFWRKSMEKLLELQKLLSKISTMRNGKGGDVFFRGLAKTFYAQPVMPPQYVNGPQGVIPPQLKVNVHITDDNKVTLDKIFETPKCRQFDVNHDTLGHT